MHKVSDRWLVYAIENAEAHLDNCEECGPGVLDCWLCSQCIFWKRELALLLELRHQRGQTCDMCCHFANECGGRWCLELDTTVPIGFGCVRCEVEEGTDADTNGQDAINAT